PPARDAGGERLGRVPRCRGGGAAVDAPGDRGAAVRQRRVCGECRGAALRAPAGNPRRQSGRWHRRRRLDPVADRPMTTATPTPPATGPVSRIDPEAAYRRPTAPGPALLRLDSNEGVLPPQALLAQLAAADPELLRRYPEVSALEAALAARLDVPPERVIVTAGADEAIDRACRAFLEPGKSVLLPDPCFDMFERCAALAGGTLVRVPWRDGPFPLDRFLGHLDARTGVVVVVSPSNPTGAVATLADVRRLAAAAPNALLVIDHVYVEYADEDLTPGLLDLANVLVLRTFSKAWGLAGCRVGYAAGSPYVIGVLRAAVVVRDFPGRPGLETALRITLPGNPPDFEWLCEALDAALGAGEARP